MEKLPVLILVGILAAIATLVAAVLTFAGVLISNANTRRNLKAQLAHDSIQRDLERKMSVRREVFLEAASALAHANASIGRAADLQSDLKIVVAEFASDLAILSKVQIVGADETVEAVMNYVNALGPAFMEMLMMRTPMLFRQQMIDLEANPEIKHKLVSEQTAAQIEAGERGIAFVTELGKLIPDAIIAVRKEMNFQIDMVRYRQLLNAQYEKMNVIWAKSKAQLERLMIENE